MSIVATVKTVLEADATLLAAATGGVWDFDETGRKGINRTGTPTAFDANGILKPCLLVRGRSQNVDPALQDDANQVTVIREVFEVWIYQDTGYTTIRTLRDRVYRLLHAKPLAGTYRVQFQAHVPEARDPLLDASVERSDYLAVYKRSV
jgi:hypothetical protein